MEVEVLETAINCSGQYKIMKYARYKEIKNVLIYTTSIESRFMLLRKNDETMIVISANLFEKFTSDEIEILSWKLILEHLYGTDKNNTELKLAKEFGVNNTISTYTKLLEICESDKYYLEIKSKIKWLHEKGISEIIREENKAQRLKDKIIYSRLDNNTKTQKIKEIDNYYKLNKVETLDRLGIKHSEILQEA